MILLRLKSGLLPDVFQIKSEKSLWNLCLHVKNAEPNTTTDHYFLCMFFSTTSVIMKNNEKIERKEGTVKRYLQFTLY